MQHNQVERPENGNDLDEQAPGLRDKHEQVLGAANELKVTPGFTAKAPGCIRCTAEHPILTAASHGRLPTTAFL